MASERFEPLPHHRVAGVEALRAYAHPTRMALLSILAQRPMTLSMAAKQIGVHPANLGRHFRVLERSGLIVLVEKRDTGRNLEKYYRAAALSFHPALDELEPAGKRELALEALRDELGAAIQLVKSSEFAKADLAVYLKSARLRPKDRAYFYRRLEALVRECAARESTSGAPYAIGLCLFPVAQFAEGAHEIRMSEGE